MYHRLNNLVLSIILSIFLITSTSSYIQPISNDDNLQIELSDNNSGLVKVLNPKWSTSKIDSKMLHGRLRK